MIFKCAFLFAEPVYFDVPVTQLLSYYPQFNINSPESEKSAGLQPPLHQLANNAAQQISIPVYAPVYNQKQLVSSAKTSYSTVVPTTFRTKVSLDCIFERSARTSIIIFYFYANNYVITILQYHNFNKIRKKLNFFFLHYK